MPGSSMAPLGYSGFVTQLLRRKVTHGVRGVRTCLASGKPNGTATAVLFAFVPGPRLPAPS